MLSTSPDGTEKLWDVDTGQVIHTIERRSTPYSSKIAFSPDGARIFSSSGKRIKLWDAASGQAIRTFTTDAPHDSVAFSPDGGHLLTSSQERFEMRDHSTGDLIRTFDVSNVNAMVNGVAPFAVGASTFSSDGTRLFLGRQDGTLEMWDVGSRKRILTLSGHDGYISFVAFSRDGAYALSGGSDDKTVKLWHPVTGQLVRAFSGHASVTSVAFAPNGRQLLSGGSDKTIKLWDAATVRLICQFVGHTHAIASVAFAPDGASVLSGSEDGTVKSWDTASGRVRRTFSGHSSFVRSVAYSRDGKRFVSGSSDKTVKLWEVHTGRLLRSFQGHEHGVSSVAISPDGKHVFSAGTASLFGGRTRRSSCGTLNVVSWFARSKRMSMAFPR